MSTWLRLFSKSFRHAVQAEATGHYLEAARAYSLCGQRLKVAEMHLLEAESRGTPASALRELQLAAHFVHEHSEVQQPLLLRIGQAYLRVLQKSALSTADRELCVQAARLLQRAGDLSAAATAYELAGDTEQAATLYQEAGELEKVETLLGQKELLRQRQAEEREQFANYQLQLRLGQRELALTALQACLAATNGPDRAEPLRLLEALTAKQLTSGQLRLLLMDEPSAATAPPPSEPAQAMLPIPPERHFVGVLPLGIGRDADCALALPDPGVSRRHAQVEFSGSSDGTGTWMLRDLGAKNGTSLNGLALHHSGCLPLREQGVIGIGQQASLRFWVYPSELQLQVIGGQRRGLLLRVCAPLQSLPLTAELGPGVSLRFVSGRPVVTPGEAPLLLHEQRVQSPIQLIVGDELSAANRRCQVL